MNTIEAVKGIIVDKKVSLGLKIFYDAKTDKHIFENVLKVSTKCKPEREYIFKSDYALKHFIFEIKRLVYILRQSYIVVE